MLDVTSLMFVTGNAVLDVEQSVFATKHRVFGIEDTMFAAEFFMSASKAMLSALHYGLF